MTDVLLKTAPAASRGFLLQNYNHAGKIRGFNIDFLLYLLYNLLVWAFPYWRLVARKLTD